MIEKSLFTYFIEAFTKNYVNFKGRARRKEYWGFTLFYALIFAILGAFAFTGIGVILFLVVFVVTLPPSISLTVRRLHDINLSGWFTLYMLIMLIPVIGEGIAIIISIVIGVVQGSAKSNKFGENPIISNK
ncbi:DUF805 domain-containing protein [Haemophilus parainfluenzae]|jgi:hypothetical protein|uniref:DUF805 domain-containing protein n=1 Tax=Haemophilus parainfluenzae TaxID=729 RepID=UPI00066E71D9|nr:DUF805 domain-containing protein [Haemophilus parainfluenzae]MDU5695993.1 DUF805 domain-containing protein [Haemophilus parainfluenzae]MDU5724670.1 DUF805 domain-containing protein [Haemophilus parainfluenzae]MDU5778018.1 DUF805 domain-containing protein [Haemophilus parainfluenzae]